jgi:hypothetical protein
LVTIDNQVQNDKRVLSAIQSNISVRCSESWRVWVSRFIGSIDTGKRDRDISFVSEARRTSSGGNFDCTNNSIGEYFLEEVQRKICIDNNNLPSDTRLTTVHSQLYVAAVLSFPQAECNCVRR